MKATTTACGFAAFSGKGSVTIWLRDHGRRMRPNQKEKLTAPWRSYWYLTSWVLILLVTPILPLHAAEPAFDQARWEQRVENLSDSLVTEPDDLKTLSLRGDANFFLGQFDAAVRDYDRMVLLDDTYDASHWRRGIAWFYAGEFEKAASQFERYHSFDNVDRENGIWRYLCQVKAKGVEAAEQGLLKYEKDDREPFGDVYRLFSGDISPGMILERIQAAKISDVEREKRLFYAELYIGLWHAVHDRASDALPHLKAAANNSWAPTAGYGPSFMWHVGRLHHNIILKEQND